MAINAISMNGDTYNIMSYEPSYVTNSSICTIISANAFKSNSTISYISSNTFPNVITIEQSAF